MSSNLPTQASGRDRRLNYCKAPVEPAPSPPPGAGAIGGEIPRHKLEYSTVVLIGSRGTMVQRNQQPRDNTVYNGNKQMKRPKGSG